MSLASGSISPEERERAERIAQERGIPVDRAAVALGILTEEQLLYLAAEEAGLDLVFPSEEGMDRELLDAFPADILRRHGALPLLREDGVVVVAFPEAPGPQALADVEGAAGGRVRPVLAPPRRLRQLLDRVVGGGAVDAARVSADDASGMTAFYRHLAAAFGEGADELRFDPVEEGIRVRYRKGGALIDAGVEPRHLGAGISTRARMLAGLAVADQTMLQDSVFATRIRGEDIHLRTVILAVGGGEAILLQRTDGRAEPGDLTEFGLSQSVIGDLGTILGPAGGNERKGRLILVAAPEASLVAAFARALRQIVDGANVTAAAGFNLPGVLAPATPENTDQAVHSTLALMPDVLFVNGGSEARAARVAVAAALAGMRVVYGLVDAIPEYAPHLLQAAGVHPTRLGLVLSFVVAIRREPSGCVIADASRPATLGEGTL